jgi:release factor glutamine methyltransferase
VTTIADVLRTGIERLRASGSETPRLDAELLLGHAIGVDRTFVLAHPDAPVSVDGAARFDADLARRERGEPVAYIRGFKEFYGLAFSTDPRALIPRPETERLVELAEQDVVRRLVSAPRPPGARPIRIADIGTGCGTIAVALAVALRRRRIVDEIEILGIDESTDALDLARENAVGHSVGDRVRFIEADLLPPVVVDPFDLVLANLPYVASETLPGLPVAASFEPARALDGGSDGLLVIRRLLERLPEALAPGGVALLEIGADQADGIAAAVASILPGWRVTIEPDLAGAPRVARVERDGAAP